MILKQWHSMKDIKILIPLVVNFIADKNQLSVSALILADKHIK